MSEDISKPINSAEAGALSRLLSKLKTRELQKATPSESRLLGRLLLAGEKGSDTKDHWYCHRASELTREAATFTQLWLVVSAQEDVAVAGWRKRHRSILDTCVDCVKGMEDALLSSQFTYLSEHKKDKVTKFFDHYTEWNAERLRKRVEQLGDDDTIDKLNPAQSYHIFYNPAILSNPGLWSLIERRFPSERIQGWPKAAPAGLVPLFLLRTEVREWVDMQIEDTEVPQQNEGSPEAYFFRQAYDGIVTALGGTVGVKVLFPTTYTFKTIFDGSFSSRLWRNLPALLRRFPAITTPIITIPDEQIGSVGKKITLFGVVINHLSRIDDVFPAVLETFQTVLDQQGRDVWNRKAQNLPQKALEDIKNNPSFLSTDAYRDGNVAKTLGWLDPFLRSVTSLEAFSKVLHDVFQTFLERLQHESLRSIHPIVLNYFFSAAAHIHKAPIDNEPDVRPTIIDASNIHSGVIVRSALRLDLDVPQQREARRHAQKFLSKLLSYSVDQIDEIFKWIPRLEKQQPPVYPIVSSSYQRLWASIRTELPPADIDGHTFYFRNLVKASSIVELPPAKLINKETPILVEPFRDMLDVCNKSLAEIHKGFGDLAVRFVEASSKSKLATFCSEPGMHRALAILLLSPVQSFSEGAQTLIGEAYNAEDRRDCLRVLLVQDCDVTIRALNQNLERFNDIVIRHLLAVEASKVLARGYADLLDVLCSIQSGLLLDVAFKEKNRASMSLIPPLWKLMCTAAGHMIQQTPIWSPRYPRDDMTWWMRDVLLFAGELVVQRRHFESAWRTPTAAGVADGDGEIVMDLMLIMFPLKDWLRLSDEELLALTYNLFLELLEAFKESKITPPEERIKGLEQSIKKLQAGKEDRLRTKLSPAQIGTLIRRIAGLFGDEDSDVEFVSQTFSPKKVDQVPKPTAKASVKSTLTFQPNMSKAIQGQSSKSKSSSSTAKAHSIPGPKPPPAAGTGMMQRLGIGGTVTSVLAPDMVQSAIAERKAAKLRGFRPPQNTMSSSGADSSSSSESDSEIDGQTTGLAQLSKLHKSPIKKQHHERRKAILLNTTDTRSHTAAQSMRSSHQPVKYIPDLGPLHRIILSWDYNFDGPEPKTNNGQLNLKPVPNTFNSHRDYLDILHPLFIIECWNSLIKSKEERLDKVNLVVAAKMYVDYWVELDVMIEESVPRGWMLMETDIVLLEHSGGTRVIAKVHGSRQTRQGIQATLRYSVESNKIEVERVMALQSSWLISRIFNLSTVHREYTALMGMNYYDWADTVYRARVEPPIVPSEANIQKTMAAHRLNHPQARAVLSSLETRGFSLIQGPPGTGKTSTICGLVGAFLSTRKSPVTTIQVGNVGHKIVTPRKVLVCAPSNAAIDELAKRLKDGVWTSQGSSLVPKVVRLGADSSINISVKEVSLDQLILERTSKTKGPQTDSAADVSTLRAELGQLKQRKETLLNEQNSAKTSSSRQMEIERELKAQSLKRIDLSNRLTSAQDRGRETARARDSAKRRARTEILNEADVVCCTLSGAGHDVIEQFEFDLVIIDEAAQAIELSALIPLKFSSNRCVLVGDPQQLPPTVISQVATKFKYSQSLFVRLQSLNPDCVHLLSIQYRMHPEISRIPSKLFYRGELQDGPDMSAKTAQPWHASSTLGVYKFFDVRGQEEQADMGHSQYNIKEVEMAASIYASLKMQFPKVNLDYRIGIVSMYRAQLGKLKDKFASRWGRDILSKIDFNTVDGFQGQEKDIIILSCVRAGSNISSIGFLSDTRRINVAITRSRSSLFILGNAPTLMRNNNLWKEVIQDAKERGALVTGDSSYLNNPAISETTEVLPVTISPKKKKRLSNKETASNQKALTPKEWKAKYQERPVVTQPNNDGLNDQVMADADNLSTESSTAVPSRKRERSDPYPPPRPPPALRDPTVPFNGASESTEQATNSNPPLPTKPRLPPKPKTANLFIPKKPLKRPPP